MQGEKEARPAMRMDCTTARYKTPPRLRFVVDQESLEVARLRTGEPKFRLPGLGVEGGVAWFFFYLLLYMEST